MDEARDRSGEDVEVLDLLIVLVRRARMIGAATLAAAVVAAAVSFLLPALYRAETKILPPQQGSPGAAAQLISQIAPAAGLGAGVAAIPLKTPNDLYVEMLKSRTVLDRIVDRFGLMKEYDTKYRQDARKKLLKSLKVEDDKKSGIIAVSVEDRDRDRAARMANAFVEELKRLAGGLAVTEAAQRRLFFEEQLRETKAALSRSEEAVKSFQAGTGAFHLDTQAKAVIESIAALRAQIAAKEVQLKVLRTYATSSNPELQRAEEELRGLKAELAKMEGRAGTGHDPLMPTGRMPAVGAEYGRRLRDLKFNETLYELLVKQYEAARLDEARDAAVIQVIDPAVPPEKKAKPRRLLIVCLSAGAALLLSILWAFGTEYAESVANDPERKGRLSAALRDRNG